jgi:molybdopterin/thiamine biosynthesis adenylyltransferase
MQPDYSRQILLKEIGAAGQAKLAASRVLVVGAGGLGSPVLQYLAGAGVGVLGIIDADTLHESNLHRQPIYALSEVGEAKAALAAAAVASINPAVRVEPHNVRFDANNALPLVRAHDVVVDCSDNFRTKFLINDAAVLARRPAVFASVYQYEGQIQVYRPAATHACLRCLWPDATADGVVGNCAEAGVLGPVPGAFGCLQALLTIKLLVGMPGQLDGELLLMDFMNFGSQGTAPRRMPRTRLRPHPRAAGRGAGHRNFAPLACRRGAALRTRRCEDCGGVRGEAHALAPYSARRTARGQQRVGPRCQLSAAVRLR